ncbi:MAG: hypothetical protein ABSA97_00690 [Verrucomicrobiia bacterium]
MAKEIKEALIHIAELIGAGIVGGLIVAFATHRLTISRDRISGKVTRKREFLRFMRAWRIEVDRTHLEPGGFARHPSSLTDSVSDFGAVAELIHGDFTGERRKKFDGLVDKITRFTGGELYTEEGHKKVQKAFDDEA